jgi:hypothetical protein
VPTSDGKRRKLFSEVLKDGHKRYKITLKTKDNSQSPKQIKLQLKKDINPTEIKVSIKTLKTLWDGKIRGGPRRNRNRSLVGGPVVVHASAARCLLWGLFCISLPTGIV